MADQNDKIIEASYTCVSCKRCSNASKEKFEEHMLKAHGVPNDAVATLSLLAHGDAAETYTNVYAGRIVQGSKVLQFTNRTTFKRGKKL